MLRRHDWLPRPGVRPVINTPWQLAVAAGSMACALVLTHAFWGFVRFTPFVFGFTAAVVSTRVGGRRAGFLSVIIGVCGHAVFPPPLSQDGTANFLFRFLVL